MITKIQLQNFKCFSDLNLSLGKLTLLTGKNSSGKSSILQSLAILNQTMVENEWSKSIYLNGLNVSLGTAGDVINQSLKGAKNEITVGLNTDSDLNIRWNLFTQKRNEYDLIIKKFLCKTSKDLYNNNNNDKDFFLQNLFPKKFIEINKSIETFSKKLRTLTYISADRIPPLEFYDVGSNDSNIVVGSKGQFTIWILKTFDELDVNEELIYPGKNLRILIRQVESWLSHFFPRTALQIYPIPNVSKLSLGIKTSKETEFLRPQNVGYGITQLLPIITACLKAKKGDIILIENPEAHLHPFGQSEMGVFLSKVAASGVQLIVESHSDNVLNGIRKGVLNNPNLDYNDVAIYFFNDFEVQENRIIPIKIEPNGDLSDFPLDFFDQGRQDLREILRLSRR